MNKEEIVALTKMQNNSMQNEVTLFFDETEINVFEFVKSFEYMMLKARLAVRNNAQLLNQMYAMMTGESNGKNNAE